MTSEKDICQAVDRLHNAMINKDYAQAELSLAKFMQWEIAACWQRARNVARAEGYGEKPTIMQTHMRDFVIDAMAKAGAEEDGKFDEFIKTRMK